MAKANLKSAEAQEEQARLNLAYTRVTAPEAGRVAHKNVAGAALRRAHLLRLRLVADAIRADRPWWASRRRCRVPARRWIRAPRAKEPMRRTGRPHLARVKRSFSPGNLDLRRAVAELRMGFRVRPKTEID
jgi:multidrug efflux pump subunit AcrA (membrane-fusion protein)